MRLQAVSVKEFRRFTDLKISELPESAKLIMLCGPNGSGKSSLFDAFRAFQSLHGVQRGYSQDDEFFNKLGYDPYAEEWRAAIYADYRQRLSASMHSVQLRDGDPRYWKLFYIRTAYRNDADFTVSGLTQVGEAIAETRPGRTIDNDVSVNLNYARLVSGTVQSLYSAKADDPTTAYELRESYIGEIRTSLQCIFPDLILSGVGEPLVNGSFYFSKGAVDGFKYKNLSAGEKAVFDLLLDLIVKRKEFDDTIWCIDEPELHLNTAVQGRLLRELVDLIPDNSQLILASHSIGFMKEAAAMSAEQPGSVVFLDFGGADFDGPVRLKPVEVNRDFWRRILAVAFGDMAKLVSPEKVVLCEGRPVGQKRGKNTEFDARCYRAIFHPHMPDVEFISVGSSDDVVNDKVQLGQSVQMLTPGTALIRVTDRDLMNTAEVEQLEKSGVRVLSRRHIESYLLDDEVLSALCEREGKPEEATTLIGKREELLAKAQNRGIDPDDLKSIAGELYVFIRKHLGLVGVGSGWEAFAVGTLAPLLRPGMKVYDELRQAIFRDRQVADERSA